MECSNVGPETLLLIAITIGLVAAFVVRARSTQTWLREHPRAAGGFGLTWALGWVLHERNLWVFRVMFGAFPLLMSVASLAVIYCVLQGPG